MAWGSLPHSLAPRTREGTAVDEVIEKLRVDDFVVEKEGSSLLLVVRVADSVAVEV